MRCTRSRVWLGAVSVAAWVALATLWPASAEAVPAFARKYQTSCQTCHIVFPKLNAFGEAFRLRGYRMPAETEDMVKQKPVSMGRRRTRSSGRRPSGRTTFPPTSRSR